MLWPFKKAQRCACCGCPIDGIPQSFVSELPLGRLGLVGPDAPDPIVPNHDLYSVGSTHFFIRAVLPLPIIGTDKSFDWGVWCTLSQESYSLVLARWNAPDRANDPPRFGWLVADLPGYAKPTWNLKTMVHQRPPGQAPWVEIEPGSHPLADEQAAGITVPRWHELARAALGWPPGPVPTR